MIAPIYGALDHYVKNHFSTAIRHVSKEIPLAGKSVLDIGTGPGAWAALFREHGAAHVHGVDMAERMIRQAQKRYYPAITFSVGNALDLSAFADESFDIVTASFVLHGVKQPIRVKMLAEMRRITRHHIVIHDYHGPTPPVARFLEYLEKSDYRHFKVHFFDEMRELFGEVRRKEAVQGAAVYFGTK